MWKSEDGKNKERMKGRDLKEEIDVSSTSICSSSSRNSS
jgi:hypothetical protein